VAGAVGGQVVPASIIHDQFKSAAIPIAQRDDRVPARRLGPEVQLLPFTFEECAVAQHAHRAPFLQAHHAVHPAEPERDFPFPAVGLSA